MGGKKHKFEPVGYLVYAVLYGYTGHGYVLSTNYEL
jgi:hypothetical protein